MPRGAAAFVAYCSCLPRHAAVCACLLRCSALRCAAFQACMRAHFRYADLFCFSLPLLLPAA